MSEWAVFKGEEQVSKSHTTKLAAIIEAFEKGWFNSARGKVYLQQPYTIEETRK
jgi:hypothetical protein